MLQRMALQVLDRLSFGESSVSRSAKGLTRVMLFNYWLTYSVLKAKRPKFQRMRLPVVSEATTDKENDSAEASAVPLHNGNGVH